MGRLALKWQWSLWLKTSSYLLFLVVFDSDFFHPFLISVLFLTLTVKILCISWNSFHVSVTSYKLFLCHFVSLWNVSIDGVRNRVWRIPDESLLHTIVSFSFWFLSSFNSVWTISLFHMVIRANLVCSYWVSEIASIRSCEIFRRLIGYSNLPLLSI